MIPIFLIGYMASGKTAMGKRLAERLGLQFVDTDTFIENRYRKTVAEIFEERGESGFREIERRTLLEIADFENVVIATGGGLPCYFNNIEIMNGAGITVYLQTDAEELAARLETARQKRPLVKGKTAVELKNYVETSLSAREKFYLQAKIILDCNLLFAEDMFDAKVSECVSYISAISI
jgi:shikimate kinase